MPAYSIIDSVLLPSASRTTTQTSANLYNDYGTKAAIAVVLDATVIGSATLLVTIDGLDQASGKWINLLTGASITTNSTNRYLVGPSIAASANAIAQTYVPSTFRIVVTQGGSGAATYSVSYTVGG